MPKEGRYWSSNPIASIWACELQPFSRASPLETFRGNWSLAAKTKERAVFGGRLSFVLLSFDTAITRSMLACVTLRDLSSYVFFLTFSSVEINSSNNNNNKHQIGKNFDWSQIRLHFKWHRPKIQTAVYSWDLPSRQLLSTSSLFRFSCRVQDEL